MKAIDVKHVLKKAQEEPKQKVKISIVRTSPAVQVTKEPPALPIAIQQANAIQVIKDGVKSDEANQAWADYHNQKLDRKKLSSSIFDVVKSGATKDKLKELYHKIVALGEKSSALFLRARNVEQGDRLPEGTNQAELLQLKEDKRKLSDQRCKLQAKIKKGEAKNPGRVTEWHLKLDRANAEYQVIDDKIKTLTGRA